MNYLAHLSLAYPDTRLMAGNYIADLLRSKEKESIHPELMTGVLFHRWIDYYSNNNKSLREINKAFHQSIHKYAPVASDIICDYLLYKSWDQHFDISFADFSDYTYEKLKASFEIMPQRIALICKSMVEHKWLEQYKTMEGLEFVLKRTNLKTRFVTDLTKVLPVLKENEKIFIQHFNVFFRQCKAESLNWLSLQNEMKM